MWHSFRSTPSAIMGALIVLAFVFVAFFRPMDHPPGPVRSGEAEPGRIFAAPGLDGRRQFSVYPGNRRLGPGYFEHHLIRLAEPPWPWASASC